MMIILMMKVPFLTVFFYFKSDGEKSTEPLWKQFKVPILDENGEKRYNENGKTNIIIACDTKSLHSTIFLTNQNTWEDQENYTC